MKVKICGITNFEDALEAVKAGADMLGFNFYAHSPRAISIETCAEVVAELRRLHPAVRMVGVFVNESVEGIEGTLKVCDLDFAQLHGDEKPSDVRALSSCAFKAIRPRSEEEADLQRNQFAGIGIPAPALLLDAYKLGVYGGTGEAADWRIAAKLARSVPLLLAGGLTPDNVRAAIDQVQPWGVDTASGVERAPGRKDVEKMKAFVRVVRERETERTTC